MKATVASFIHLVSFRLVNPRFDRLFRFTLPIGFICAGLIFSAETFAQLRTVDFFSEPFGEEYEEKIAGQFDDGITDFFTGYTARIVRNRKNFWNRDFTSAAAYNGSIGKNRTDLKKILGITDTIMNVELTVLSDIKGRDISAFSRRTETSGVNIYNVKWSVYGSLQSEGLLLVPKGEIKASVVLIPDADETPEQYAGLAEGPQTGLAMAENGIRVLIPVLVSRTTDYSGSNNLYPGQWEWMRTSSADTIRWTNEPAREWIWRQGFIMGKSIVGMEVQKIEAAIKWLKQNPLSDNEKVGIMGYEEGGLVGMYASALNTEVDATWISGYFGPRENLWSEPVSRNLWGLLNEFGDAEIGSMIMPRSLIVESAPIKSMSFPLPPKEGQRNFGLKGRLKTPVEADVISEIDRLKDLFPEESAIRPDITFIGNAASHGSAIALKAFGKKLGASIRENAKPINTGNLYAAAIKKREKRVFDNMQQYIQGLIPMAGRKRELFVQGNYASPEAWDKKMEPYRKYFYENIVGKVDEPLLPANARTRKIYDEPEWTGYEVALDVWPGVYAWGILAVPKGIKKGERLPAVVMQHGNGGLPTTSLLVSHYHGVLKELAKAGFVAFSPYNSYFFNIRKAHAVRANDFSVIIPQYQQILNYLKSLDYVDGEKIALYGKSWGGWTALNVPAVIKDFKASVCVGFYNDWLKKTVDIHYAHNYFYENSLCIYNWDMGNTILHAELAKLILPRPFMVVAGLYDGVARPEDVAAEYEKVNLIYQILGISDRTEIDFWEGAHEIDLKTGGIPFLKKHLIK